MEIPISRLGHYLISNVKSNYTDKDIATFSNNLLREISKSHIKGLILDISAIEVMDSYTVRSISTLIQVLKIKGVETVIIGIQPEIAITMVQLGLNSKLNNVSIALDLEEGIELLNKKTKQEESV